MENKKSIALDESEIPRENNRLRINKLASLLLESGFKELTEIILDVAISCPNYASQITEADEFVVEMSQVLDGLSFKHLEQFVSDQPSLERAHTISSQAMKTKTALFVSNGVVCLAKQPDSPE